MTATLQKVCISAIALTIFAFSFAPLAHADGGHNRGYCHNPGRHLGWDGAKWHFMFHFCNCY